MGVAWTGGGVVSSYGDAKGWQRFDVFSLRFQVLSTNELTRIDQTFPQMGYIDRCQEHQIINTCTF